MFIMGPFHVAVAIVAGITLVSLGSTAVGSKVLVALIVFGGALGLLALLLRHKRLKTTLGGGGEGALAELRVRLEEIERRLTDVQDVMIALSEKFDRWEAESARL